MNRLLVLHCGPMKTGSTAIQDSLNLSKKKLLELGIGYYHLRAKTLLLDLERVISRESHSDKKVILASSEFFGQVSPKLLNSVLQSFKGDCHAILISRPLRELYPSLYLQNLKGSSRRITSFQYFLQRQIRSDLAPEKGLGGQLMNAPALDARLSAAGCTTHWIVFSRRDLISLFRECLEEITDVPLGFLLENQLPKARGLSPRRSLRMDLAGLARVINYLNRINLLHDRRREELLIALLDVSDWMNQFLGVRPSLSLRQLNACNAVDRLINEPFLNGLGIGMVKEQ